MQSELSIIKGEERAFSPQLLHRVFEKNVNRGCGPKTAVIFSDTNQWEKTVDYDTLNRIANRIADYLLEQISLRKLQPNQDGDFLIGICMKPSDKIIAAILAVLKTGAAYLPIDMKFPQNRIDHIMNEARPMFIIYDDRCVDSKLFGKTNAISFDECCTQSQNHRDINIPAERTVSIGKPDDIFVVLYTSGSTGVPKGVRIPHSILWNRFIWQWEVFPYAESEQIGVFKTVLTFFDSIPEIFGPLLHEKALLVVPQCVTTNPSEFITILDKYEIQRLIIVPSLLKSILIYMSIAENPYLLRNLRLWTCTSETLPLSLVKEFYNFFTEERHTITNFYGTTEMSGDDIYFICQGKAHINRLENLPIGRPTFNTIVYILDEKQSPVEHGVIGEMYISGLNLSPGYVNSREKERFIRNPFSNEMEYSRLYRTGDFASFRKDGLIHYEGRADSQIKIRGHRVDLSEVEKNIQEINGVVQAVAICYHAGEMDQEILAFLHIKSITNMEQIKCELKRKLVNYMIPKLVVVDKIPLLIHGKIDRQELLRIYQRQSNRNVSVCEFDYSGIRDNDMLTAKILLQTIADVTGNKSISVNDNFYDIGGNSLNSLYTVAKLKERNYFIDISCFITSNTLKDMIPNMRSLLSGDSNTPNRPIGDELKLKIVPLANKHKDVSIDIVSKCFFYKAELDQYLSSHTSLKLTDYQNSLNAMWSDLLESTFSFVVFDRKNRMIGVSYNFNGASPLDVRFVGSLYPVSALLDHFETPHRLKLPTGQPIMFTYMMATHEDLSPPENIAIMAIMEGEVLRLAEEKNCAGIFTTNTSPLTQQLASIVNGYEILNVCQPNQFVLNGEKPFKSAPDTYKITIEWKPL